MIKINQNVQIENYNENKNETKLTTLKYKTSIVSNLNDSSDGSVPLLLSISLTTISF